jgi:serine protease Do
MRLTSVPDSSLTPSSTTSTDISNHPTGHQEPPVSNHESNRDRAGRRIIIWSLIFGLLGGGIGSFVFVHYLAAVVPISRQAVLVQESSAVIDVAKKVSPSVVSITTKTISPGQTFFGLQSSGGTTSEAAGTGMIITANGLILTNNHVIDGSSTITVFTSDGKQHKATLIAANTAQDYAFIKIDATGLPPVKLGDSDSVQIGQGVVAIGNALGEFNNTVTNGIISGKGRPVQAGDQSGTSASESLQDLFQTNAAINPGNSGGPLVDFQGNVIGINTAVASNAQNIGFAIPINEVKTAINNVEAKGIISHPYLGVRYVPITPSVAASSKLPVVNGAYVSGGSAADPAVVPGSPAESAGIKEGDIITKIDNLSVDESHSLTSLLARHNPGDKVTITILRDGKTVQLSATLGTTPS